jgi:hypothetical protein
MATVQCPSCGPHYHPIKPIQIGDLWCYVDYNTLTYVTAEKDASPICWCYLCEKDMPEDLPKWLKQVSEKGLTFPEIEVIFLFNLLEIMTKEDLVILKQLFPNARSIEYICNERKNIVYKCTNEDVMSVFTRGEALELVCRKSN